MKAATLGPKANFLFRPKGIATAICIIVVAWAIMRSNLMMAVFMAVIVLFIIGLKRPLWALTAVLVAQLTITSFMVATPFMTISLRLLLICVTLLLLREPIARREVDLGPGARTLVIPMLLFIGISIIGDMVNAVGFDYIFKNARNLLTGLLFIILLPAIVYNVKQLKALCSVLLLVTIASAIIGVLQHYNIFGMGQATLLQGFMNVLGRVPGMGETELELAYILPATFMVIGTVFLCRGIKSHDRRLLLIPALPIVMALYFTYTRSALFALACGVISVFFFMKTRIKWQIIMIVIFLLVGYLGTSDMLGQAYLGGRSERGQEGSSVARAILLQAGVAIAIDNPIFGIGGGRFKEVSPEYAYKVDEALIGWEANRYWTYRTLGNDEPHNDFVTTWLSYGSIALAVFFWIHLLIIRNYMIAYRTAKNRFVKGLAVGLAAAFITYVANSFYHNLLATLPLLWILAGFSLVTVKLAAGDRKNGNATAVAQRRN